jgi:hypothetical protein
MTAIPALLPPTTAELAVPYLTPGGFKAYPTWLDLDNLIPGGADAMQEDELADVLLTASEWCVDTCENMRLDAHYVQGEQLTVRASPAGRITLQPRDIPVRSIISLSYGWAPEALNALSLPDPSMRNTGGRLISFRPGGLSQQFTGPAIQFGAQVRPQCETYVTWSYAAGFPNSTLSGQLAQAATSVTLSDPTGVLPGDVLRIYDLGVSEALTVAASYVPAIPAIPATATAVPLAAPARFTHQPGTGITGFPRKIIQAVICYTVALLTREDVSWLEPESGHGPSSRTVASGAGEAGGLINDGLEFLAPYRPVFRS